MPAQTDRPTCKPLTALTLPCPCCGTKDACISVQLHELSEDGSTDEFYCGYCENRFGRSFINAILARWPAIIAWVEQCPQFETEE